MAEPRSTGNTATVPRTAVLRSYYAKEIAYLEGRGAEEKERIKELKKIDRAMDAGEAKLRSLRDRVDGSMERPYWSPSGEYHLSVETGNGFINGVRVSHEYDRGEGKVKYYGWFFPEHDTWPRAFQNPTKSRSFPDEHPEAWREFQKQLEKSGLEGRYVPMSYGNAYYTGKYNTPDQAYKAILRAAKKISTAVERKMR